MARFPSVCEAAARLARRRPVLAALFCLAAASALPAGAPATENENRDNEQRDTRSRNEVSRLDHIPLQTHDGYLRVQKIVLIETRIVAVAETRLGVDFESLDRLDVSSVPLLGSLFDAPLKAADLSDENRVGTVYAGGDGALVAVLDGTGAASGTLTVVNGKGRYDLVERPRLLETVPSDLGELGTLTSVRSVIDGSAPPGTTVVLGGLTATSVPETEGKVPVLGDLPVLQRLFRGSVHRREKTELIVFIRPSVIAGDEEG
ncbi:MAG: hypothetical protein Kow00114_12770 [Kiloniellaceae bacterium]